MDNLLYAMREAYEESKPGFCLKGADCETLKAEIEAAGGRYKWRQKISEDALFSATGLLKALRRKKPLASR